MRSFIRAAVIVAFVATAPLVSAQCPTGQVVLQVGANGPVSAGSTVAIAVTGTPGADAYLFRGPNPGATAVPGIGIICLAPPFEPVPIGQIPASGTVNALASVMGSPSGAVHVQAVTVENTASGPAFDTSNVVGIPLLPCTQGAIALSMQPDAPVQGGDTISIGMAGPPGAVVYLANSPALGTTPLPFPGLALCLHLPGIELFAIVPPSGSFVAQFQIPAGATLPPPGTTIFFQAVAVFVAGGTLAVEPSNLEALAF